MLTISRLLSEQCGIAIAHLFWETAWEALSWDEVSSSTGLREFLTKQLIKCEGEMPVGQECAWPCFEREQSTKDRGPTAPWDAILHRHCFTSWEFRDILICMSFSFFLFRSPHSFLAFFFFIQQLAYLPWNMSPQLAATTLLSAAEGWWGVMPASCSFVSIMLC